MPRFLALLILPASALACPTQSESHTVPTLLATRGEILVHDDGSKERGRKVFATFGDGVKGRNGAGKWEPSSEDEHVRRSTWKPGMGHVPVAAYMGFLERDLVAQVTFRYGPRTEPWHDQCFRIAFDRRPDITGHILSAWANLNNDFIETGFLLQHIRKTSEKRILEDLLLDRQKLSVKPETWQVAVLEVVGSEALFRMGEHVAYAKAEQIRQPKNLVSLTLGKTWHEIREVRIWKATPNPDWEMSKVEILSHRLPFTPMPHQYGK